MKVSFLGVLALLFPGQLVLANSLVDLTPGVFFAPVGFDSNDNVTIVIDGYLPDTCHRVRPAEVKINERQKTVLIQPRAEKFDGPCLPVTVPYAIEVNLGVLPQGRYSLQTRDGYVWEKLEVIDTPSGFIDEYFYAPIDSVTILNHEVTRFSAVLKGRFTNSCLRIQDIKIFNHGKTLEILPIMSQLEKEETGEACRETEVSFERIVPLPQTAVGPHLVHVRSINGQAVSAVFRNLWE